MKKLQEEGEMTEPERRMSTDKGLAFHEFIEDQTLPRLEEMLAALVPIVKVDSPGRFMIGTEIRQLILRGD